MAADAAIMAEFGQAMAAMYGNSGQEQRRTADRWLQHFSTTPEAWGVCGAIVGNPGTDPASPALMFALKTLHDKICCDFDDLDAAARLSLREALSGHLLTWGLRPGVAFPVVRRLALCAGALAVQMQWNEVFSYATALIGQAPPGQEVQVSRLVVELLAALPDQCNDRFLGVGDEKRRAFQQLLNGFIPQVLQFLAMLGEQAPLMANSDAAPALLRCFADWVRYCPMDPAVLAGHPLLVRSLEELRATGADEEVAEARVDLVIEVLRKYDARSENLPLVQMVVPRVMALESSYRTVVSSQDEDGVRRLARVFTEMAEAYTELLLAPQEMNQVEVVRLVLLCTSSTDLDTAGITLRFWYYLVKGWSELRRWNEAIRDWEQDAETKRGLQQRFGDSVVELCRQCVRLSTYPDDYDSSDKDEVSKFSSWRRQVGDSVGDCCAFLGGFEHVLGLTLQMAGSAHGPLSQSGEWRPLEAALVSALGALDFKDDFKDGRQARSVGDLHGVPAPMAPPLLGLLLGLPNACAAVAGGWDGCPRLREASAKLAGFLDRWLLGQGEDTLGQVFTFLYGNLTCADTQVSGAAAASIRKLCHTCGGKLGEPVLALYEQLSTFPPGHLLPKDELKVVEGLAAVANQLPSEEARAGAQARLLAPIQAKFAAAAQVFEAARAQGPAALASAASDHRRTVLGAAESFQEVARCLTRAPEPLASNGQPGGQAAVRALQLIWTAHDACLQTYSSSADSVERLCRTYKLVIRAAGPSFTPLIPLMASHLIERFQARPQPAFLYTGSILVTEFGDRRWGGAHDLVLLEMVRTFSASVFQILTSIEAFTSQPEMVEEFFYLVGRLLEYCPAGLLADAALIGSIIQCGVIGLQIDHRDAHGGIVACFFSMVAAGSTAPRTADKGAAAVDPRALGPAVGSLLGLQGGNLGSLMVGALVKCLTSERPAYGLEKHKSNPAGVLWKIGRLEQPGGVPGGVPGGGALLQQLLTTALNGVDPSVLPAQDRAGWLQKALAYNAANDEVGFFGSVRELHKHCSGRARANARALLRAQEDRS